MFIIEVGTEISSAHRLPKTRGKCEDIHGHNWKVRVQVKSNQLNQEDMAINFFDLEKHLQEMTKQLDHKYLNDLPPFAYVQPTAETIAYFIYTEMKKKLSEPGVHIVSVCVEETDNYKAFYTEDGDT